MKTKTKMKNIIGLMILCMCFVGFYLFFNAYIIIPYLMTMFYLWKGKINKLSPLFYLMIPWSFMFVMQYSTFITYTQKNENNFAIFYMVSGLALICVGYYFGNKVRFQLNRVNTNNVKNGKKNLRVNTKTKTKNILFLVDCLSVMGIIGSLLFSFEMLFIVGIDLSLLSSTRTLFISREVTIFSQLGNILSWGTLIVLPSIIWLWNKARLIDKSIWITSVLLYSSYSVLSAGRQVVFQFLIIIVGALIIKNDCSDRKKKVKNVSRLKKTCNKVLYLLTFVILIGYCLSVASGRNDGAISNSKLEVLAFYFDFSFDPEISRFFELLPDTLRDGLSEAVVYFTHEISGFTVFWSIPEIGPFFGLFSMPFLDRRFASLGLTTYSVDAKMSYVRSFMRSQGAMPVGWKTFFPYLIFDYGRVGGLIFCFFYGVMAAKVFRYYKKNRTFLSALLLVRIYIAMFYTIMFPSVCETGLWFMLVFCFGMLLFDKKALRYSLVEEG